jgi:hypothetical protein
MLASSSRISARFILATIEEGPSAVQHGNDSVLQGLFHGV